jgi:hypothetical protein
VCYPYCIIQLENYLFFFYFIYLFFLILSFWSINGCCEDRILANFLFYRFSRLRGTQSWFPAFQTGARCALWKDQTITVLVRSSSDPSVSLNLHKYIQCGIHNTWVYELRTTVRISHSLRSPYLERNYLIAFPVQKLVSKSSLSIVSREPTFRRSKNEKYIDDAILTGVSAAVEKYFAAVVLQKRQRDGIAKLFRNLERTIETVRSCAVPQ